MWWNVNCTTLERFIAGNGMKNLALIKIDTEGFEQHMLPYMDVWKEALGGKRPNLWLSLHWGFWTDYKEEKPVRAPPEQGCRKCRQNSNPPPPPLPRAHTVTGTVHRRAARLQVCVPDAGQ